MPFSVYALLLMLVLVPLVPAFVLFKVLKSRGEVGGPLYGFNIQLGGAFAGYFALFLLVLFAFRPYLIPPPTRLVWKLEGQVVDDHKRPVAITSDNFALLPTPTPPISTNATAVSTTRLSNAATTRRGVPQRRFQESFGNWISTTYRPVSQASRTSWFA